MGKNNFAEEKTEFALRQAESGTSVEEVVCWAWRCRVVTASDLGGGEPEIEAVGRGPEPRQEDVAGRALKKT
jgi:hypothetical protein